MKLKNQLTTFPDNYFMIIYMDKVDGNFVIFNDLKESQLIHRNMYKIAYKQKDHLIDIFIDLS